MISEYDTLFNVGVEFDIFEFCYLGRYICFDGCLKKGIFKLCFQQSAKGKITALSCGNIMCLSKSAI